jgi:hypothetical protein
MIHAGHFSHSGCLARVYRWTQQSRDRGLARNFGRSVVGSLDTLSRRSRSRHNGARTSPATYQYFHWGRKYSIHRWTGESHLPGKRDFDCSRRQWWLREFELLNKFIALARSRYSYLITDAKNGALLPNPLSPCPALSVAGFTGSKTDVEWAASRKILRLKIEGVSPTCSTNGGVMSKKVVPGVCFCFYVHHVRLRYSPSARPTDRGCPAVSNR